MAGIFDPGKLILKLESFGFDLWIEGTDIRFKYRGEGEPPKEAQTFLKEIREHREEVFDSLVEEIKRMPLEEFKRGNFLLKVRSSLLDEIIFFASNLATVEKCGTVAGPIYTAYELEKLLESGARGEDLKAIHEAKAIFNGRITDALES